MEVVDQILNKEALKSKLLNQCQLQIKNQATDSGNDRSNYERILFNE